MRFVLGLFLALTLSISSAAQEVQAPTPPPDGVPGGFFCDETLRLCTYITQNIHGNGLSTRLNQVGFFDGYLDGGSDIGFIRTDGSLDRIYFWHVEPEQRDRIKALIKQFDQPEVFFSRPLVEISLEMYSTTQRGLKNFNFGIESLSVGPGTDFTEGLSNSPGGTVRAGVTVGNVGLSAVLRAGRLREEIQSVTRLYALVPNLETLNYANYTPVFYEFPNTSTGVKSYQAGLSVMGSVSIGRDHSDLVQLKDFKISFGVANEKGDAIQSMLEMPLPPILFQDKISMVLFKTDTTTEMTRKNRELLSIGSAKENGFNNQFLIISARPVTWDQYMKEIKETLKNAQGKVWTDADLAALPATAPSGPLMDSLETFNRQNNSGDPILGVRLNAKLLGRDLIKRWVKVKLKGEGVSRPETTTTLGDLSTRGFIFGNLNLTQLKGKALVKYRLEVEEVAVPKPIRRTFELLYAPEMNELKRVK